MPEAHVPQDSLAPPLRRFALAAAVLTLGCAGPLWQFLRFASGDEFYSFIPLMPFVSAYVAWLGKAALPVRSRPAGRVAAGFIAAALAATAAYWRLAHAPGGNSLENVFAAGMLAWILWLAGLGCIFLGGAAMRHLAFPFCLLLFMVPLPTALRQGIDLGLQQGSALAANGMFLLAGMPFLREGLVFRLPDITLQVAPECSGIHSTWVLLITSLVAGQMILRRSWNRVLLCLVVLPLALLRNGFRIFVIGELCVHVGPRMIDSPIHHRGGPLFFALSLVPFFLLLYLLRQRERAAVAPPGRSGNTL